MQNSNIKKFNEVLEELRELYQKKNHDYGGQKRSVAEQMYSIEGDRYFATMLLQKALRIESITGLQQVNYESLEDSYRDIANYAIMALMLRVEEDSKSFTICE